MNQIIKNIRMLEKKNNQKDKTTKADTTRQMVTLNVYRANTQRNELPRFEKFQIPVQRWMTVLDALLFAKSYLDSSIGIRYSCRMASCGSCGMKINGIPKLACYTNISELEGDTVTCEPLPNFPHIRDLVTDFSQFLTHHKEMSPYIFNEKADIRTQATQGQREDLLSEFMQTPQDVEKYLPFSYCIRCG